MKMAVQPVSTSFDNYSPTQWLYLSNMDFVTPDQMPLFYDTFEPALFFTSLDPLHLCEPLPVETQAGVQPTYVGDGTNLSAIRSLSTPPPSQPSPPSPQPVIFCSPTWYEIPQRPYDHGRSQWNYTPSGPVLFQVNGYPGVNLGNALRNNFAGLEGRDDLVLQNAKMAICCRFLFPGYPPNKSPQIFTTYWNKERDPITRSKLAHDVARKLEQYLDSMRSSHVMDASIDEQWRIGEGFMHLDNMYLAKLESVSRASFQPAVWVFNPAA